jgi:pimeloyl-ACP methyl ester carboxylesterase
MKLCFSIILAAVLGLSAAGQDKKNGGKTARALEPCEVAGAEPNSKEKARCGTYEVFENRAQKKGRKIRLKIVIFPATGANKAPDPVFYIPGGPGSSATEDAPYIAADFAKVREKRDFVFLDQRGTGGSHPLNCTFFNPADIQSYLEHWNPLADVQKCREELEKTADLGLYVTSLAMDDLDEVRAALGYEKINITGGSYGTRAAQEYLKRHGKHVRAILLQGVSPTGQLMPRDFPQHTERALNGVIDECLADEACRTAFPALRTEVKTVLDKLLRGPLEVEVKAPPDGKSARVRLSRNLAAEAVRYMLYSTGGASRLPLILHLAAAGNFTPLAEAAIFYRQQIVATGATGLYLSVTCAEDLPWIKPGEGERNGENTFLGDYRLRQQREACALWRQGKIPDDYTKPARSEAPVLILTGQWDPVTPPLYGDLIAKYLPNGRHLVIPSGGHGFGGLEGLDCVTDLVAAFFERADAKGLDPSCVKNIRRRGFQLKLPEPPKPNS